VYCETVKQAQRLAAVLGCNSFHGEVDSEEERREVLRKFTSGEERVFTTTNTVGSGINTLIIRVVIHVGIRKKMRDYVQESGRAGTDGPRSAAIILRGRWIGRDGRTTLEKVWRTELGIKEYMDGRLCKRVVLDKEIDGRVDRVSCEIGKERCGVCEGKIGGRKRGDTRARMR